jgi:bifunctional non-homologous end joining protein LigD
MWLSRRPQPFDSSDHIFEIKHDGFRALAFIENGECRLVSRNGNVFRRFNELAQWLGEHLRVESAVLDGEIVCIDANGRSVFNDLFRRRGECLFFAFDLLWINGEDLRDLPLIERKARLKKLLRRKRSGVLYVNHIEEQGQALFEMACAMDLEGIVAKPKNGRYRSDERKPTWIKIKNPNYSQAEGRQEMFEALLIKKSLSGVEVS